MTAEKYYRHIDEAIRIDGGLFEMKITKSGTHSPGSVSMLYDGLDEFEKNGKPITVGIVSAGTFGTQIIS